MAGSLSGAFFFRRAYVCTYTYLAVSIKSSEQFYENRSAVSRLKLTLLGVKFIGLQRTRRTVKEFVDPTLYQGEAGQLTFT